ncbi:xanthine dehydrogenase family protein molybdopterin-binding subunit, partial [Chloroflexota bacterium]
MNREFSAIGKRLPRSDTLDKATGAAKYTVDIKLPGMMIGKVLRSPYPHANILKIDKSKAEKLAGVQCVITAQDIQPIKKFSSAMQALPVIMGKAPPELTDQSILNNKARFIGDPIAAVAATSEAIAEEALHLIEVEYKELPAVYNPVEAMKPGAPRIHDSANNNVALHMACPFPEGDVEKGFQEADCIVEDTFTTTKQVHCQLEPRSVIASFEANGRLTVWSQSQMPHLSRRQLAHVFDIPVGEVRLITPHAGGSFGGRLFLDPEYIATALAKITGKPVKVEYTREEEFHVCETRTPFQYKLRMGFKKDGILTTIQVKAITHCGGYLGYGITPSSVLMSLGMGLYRYQNKFAESDLVYTNTGPSGAFRGMGHPEAMWGVEQLMDVAAGKLGIDAKEIRLKNIKKVGEIGPTGLPIQSTALEECIKVGADSIAWPGRRKESKGEVKKRGVGMAVMMHASGAQPIILERAGAFIKLNEDGSASLVINPGDAGTGSSGAMAQIAAEELGVYYEDIHIVTGDTDITMFDNGSHASKTAYVTGNAVAGAAREAKAQLLARAANTMGVSANDLDIKDGRVYIRATPERGLPVARVAQNAIYNKEGECLDISGQHSFEATTFSPPTQAAFAEVEVDIE